ncbi:nitrate/nitrite transporter [Williamsia sp. D3]|uniref:MFS transporter n=1 Tax=Williamsia sp. D3 TaxID=1313067 RepID=UPI0003D315B1|nr:MFS transporter [Williamsia sp. D3]ETD32371.1 MFS transporter [Williamsia sp. D3]
MSEYSEGGTVRAWVVWSVGLLAYVVAVLDRTTLGVSGLDAADRFSASPSVLSTFVVLQVIVYASMQIPAGLLLDRYGSRALIVTGALIMAVGQMTLALTEALPAAIIARALVGAGDAFTFISVLRLVPRWFTPKRVPLVTQLTGILGQLGQVLSAVPFLALLNGPGWTAAYFSAVALGLLTAVLALAFVRDAPPGTDATTESVSVRETLRSIKTVWSRPGTRLGFFSHMGTQFSITVFALMWGIPYLTTGQNLSAGAAGALLSASVVSIIGAGIIIGLLTGRFPARRSWLVLGIMGSNVAIWTVVLALPAPAPTWLLVILVVVISVGGPGSVVGFDFARTFNPSKSLGTAQGMVNMGGFLVSLIVMQVMGIIIGAMGGYSFDSFRVAWTVQYAVWLIATVGILSTRRKAVREMGRERRAQLEEN